MNFRMDFTATLAKKMNECLFEKIVIWELGPSSTSRSALNQWQQYVMV